MPPLKSEDLKNRLLAFPGKIHLICSDEEISRTARDLDSATVLGFDTETRPSYRKGQLYKVALLQLSTNTDAFLFRIHRITEFELLIRLFENPKIVKTGIAIRDDIKALQKVFKFRPQNFVEIQTLAKTKELNKFGLKGLAADVLHGFVDKKAKMTNWESKDLTDKQLMYAATDAWIGLKLYEKLKD